MNSPKVMLLAVSLMAGCASAGMGTEVRTDITAQMQAASSPISACYKTALQTNRKLRGYMVLSFAAEPSSGKFVDGYVVRDELNDASVRQCVLGEVAKLKLSKPQSTKVLVNFPLHFQPNQ